MGYLENADTEMENADMENADMEKATWKRGHEKRGHENEDMENADMEKGHEKRGQAYKKFLHDRRFIPKPYVNSRYTISISKLNKKTFKTRSLYYYSSLTLPKSSTT